MHVVAPLNPDKYVGNVCLTLRTTMHVRIYLRALVFVRFLKGNTPKDERDAQMKTLSETATRETLPMDLSLIITARLHSREYITSTSL